jgi:anti-anti-sigma factor
MLCPVDDPADGAEKGRRLMVSDRFLENSRCGRMPPRVRSASPAADVALEGEIDLSACGSVVEQLAGLLVGPARVIRVDLREVTFIDAAGIEACLTAQRRAREAGYDLVYVNPQAIVARVITILDLETVLLDGDHNG